MNASHNSYKPQNARKITLYSLAAAIVIIAGVYALRAFLNHQAVSQTVAAESQPVQLAPNLQGIPLPGTAAAQINETQAAQISPTQTAPQSIEPQKENPVAKAAPVVQEPVASPQPINTQLSPDAAKLVSEADNDLKNGKFIAARDKLNDCVRMLQGNPQQEPVKAKLQQLSQMWLFGTDVIKGDTLCTTYTVHPGDSLVVIGKKFKVPAEFLQQINNISRPESLQVGRNLKVVNGPFHAIVNRSNFTMDIYLQTTFVQSFKVGLGQETMETPTGLWRAAVGGKMIKPKWTDPKSGKTYEGSDPDYPLGSRWIALDGIDGNAKGRTGFAIHGTKDPQTIGTKSSQGCIRLFNGDVVTVYNMMMPGLSEVRVVD
jgi:LysM repeat protein